MAVFIELVTDAFEATFQQQASAKRAGGNKTAGAGKRVVRRPFRGIEVKEDTYAIVKVVRSDGREIPLFDSSSPDGLSSDGYANFLLQQVQEARMEKHQIVETFGESFIFFFGENPRFVDCQAILLNSHDFNWAAEWDENYERYLRGTKLVEMGASLYLFYGDTVLQGYMLNAQKMSQVQQPYTVGLQFRLFVTNYRNLGFVDAPDNTSFPTRASISLPDGVDLTATGAAESLVNAYRGEAFDSAQADSADRTSTSLLRSFETGANPFVSGSKVSDLIQSMPRSFAIGERVWSDIINNPAVNPYTDPSRGLILRNGQPIRGLISDNTDEYTGKEDSSYSYDTIDSGEAGRVPSALAGTVRSALEVQDFFRTAIEALSCYGADINSPGAMQSLGIGVSFGSSSSTPGVPTTGSSFSSTQDPLSAVYGKSSTPSTLGPTTTPSYGYPSDHADGQPGFGVVGFGDMGGVGFGSGLGEGGDPGFKDPSRFTFAGVNDSRGAFERFMQQRNDTTSFGGGVVTPGGFYGVVDTGSSSGSSSGASVGIGGSLSAFSFVSVGGSLDSTGNARANPVQQFPSSATNPFGVNCSPRSDAAGGEDLANPYT